MPATRADLLAVLSGVKYPGLRSAVLCTEDALAADAVPQAMAHLAAVLPRLGPAGPLRFVRPRNPAVLAQILTLPGVEQLDGVCLPKCDEANLEDYLGVLEQRPQWAIMPIIETELAFSRPRLLRLRRRLAAVKSRILCLRIGGNDLLQLLGSKRPKDLTAYDTPLRRVIEELIITFRPYGYELSAPVFEHLDQPETLAREVTLDGVHGLWAKSAIHPAQLGPIERGYAVTAAEVRLARAIGAADAAPVFLAEGQMVEIATHRRWAERVLERFARYGLRD